MIKPRGKAVTKSVKTPEAQQDEKVIPNPNKIPPSNNPTLIGFIHKSKVVASSLNKTAMLINAVRKNIIAIVRIKRVEPVRYALLTLPAKPVYPRLNVYPKPIPTINRKNNISDVKKYLPQITIPKPNNRPIICSFLFICNFPSLFALNFHKINKS